MAPRGPVATEGRSWLVEGLFRRRGGEPGDARAWLGRARGLFDSLGEAVERERVDEELRALSA